MPDLSKWHTFLAICALLVGAGIWLGSLQGRVNSLEPAAITAARDEALQKINAAKQADSHQAVDNLPVGTILAFAGEAKAVPSGWAICDGRKVKVDDAPILYRAIGTTWGGEKNIYFNLPDLRGRFLRGVDLGSGRDPDAQRRQAASEGGNSGDRVGSVQADAMQSHQHNYAKLVLDWDHIDKGARTKVDNNDGGYDNAETTGLVGATASAETRPKNANVNWIIKSR